MHIFYKIFPSLSFIFYFIFVSGIFFDRELFKIFMCSVHPSLLPFLFSCRFWLWHHVQLSTLYLSQSRYIFLQISSPPSPVKFFLKILFTLLFLSIYCCQNAISEINSKLRIIIFLQHQVVGPDFIEVT